MGIYVVGISCTGPPPKNYVLGMFGEQDRWDNHVGFPLGFYSVEQVPQAHVALKQMHDVQHVHTTCPLELQPGADS